METNQLNDDNETRAAIFRHDLEQFLGLTEPLPPTLHVRPGHSRANFKEQLKIDICSRQNFSVRKDLMRIARAASQWIRTFFLKSPDVVVSSPEYLHSLLQKWMIDPCGPVFDHNIKEAEKV